MALVTRCSKPSPERSPAAARISPRTEVPFRTSSPSTAIITNWIHDRLWFHLSSLEDVPRIFVRDDGRAAPSFSSATPTDQHGAPRQRGQNQHVRQSDGARVLRAARRSACAGDIEEVRLAAGYQWIDASHDVGAPVLSLHDGWDNVVWMRELPEAGESDRSRLPCAGATVGRRSRFPTGHRPRSHQDQADNGAGPG